MSYLSSGSRFKVETTPTVEEVDVLRSKLRSDFLVDAGWDSVELILCPPRNHPLLGLRNCLSTDCLAPATSAGVDLCPACQRLRKRSGLTVEEFVLVPTGKRNRGERFCVISRCERPAGQRSGLCAAHQYRFSRHPSATIAEWVAAAQPDPLPSFGPCLVPTCPRLAAMKSQICLAHAQQWSRVKNSKPAPDFSAWVQAAEPSDTSRMVVLKGLPDRVVVEFLLGLQWRTDDHTRTSMTVLRALVRNARSHHIDSIFELLEAPLDWEKGDMAALVRAMTLAVRRSLSSPELSSAATAGILPSSAGRGRSISRSSTSPGCGRRRSIGPLRTSLCTVVARPPPTAKQTVRCVGQLSWSLRHSREDHGLEPRELGRTDIVHFTNRLAHLERTGMVTATKRHFVTLRVRRFLEDARSLGLTRSGQPLAGLPDDFRLRASDVPGNRRMTLPDGTCQSRSYGRSTRSCRCSSSARVSSCAAWSRF